MARGKRQSAARQFKRGHHLENNGRLKSPLAIHNNRRLNSSRNSIQLIKVSLPSNPKQKRVVKVIRHIG